MLLEETFLDKTPDQSPRLAGSMEMLRYILEKRNHFLCASHVVPDGNVLCIFRSFCHWKGRQSYSCLFLNCCVMLPQVTSLALLSTSKLSVQCHISYICQAYTVKRGKMKNILIGKNILTLLTRALTVCRSPTA